MKAVHRKTAGGRWEWAVKNDEGETVRKSAQTYPSDSEAAVAAVDALDGVAAGGGWEDSAALVEAAKAGRTRPVTPDVGGGGRPSRGKKG